MKKILVTILSLFLLVNCKSRLKLMPIYFTQNEISKMAKQESIVLDQVYDEYSKVGLYQKANNIYDSIYQNSSYLPFTTSDSTIFTQAYKFVSAVDFVISESRNHSLIIINEAHHKPQHRIFTTQILQGLYNNGYRYLGLETLNNFGDYTKKLNKRKYPFITNGAYCTEPQMGNLIRTALKIGFELFSYEDVDLISGKQREITQAENIAAFLNEHKTGKTIIHCGYDHIKKSKLIDWEYAMAGNLKIKHGYDPFTIDQVEFSEKSDRKYEKAMYQTFSEQFSETTVAIHNKSKKSFVPNGENGIDLFIIHPKSQYINNRADWLFFDNYVPVRVLPTKKLKYPLLGFAYLANEKINFAVPVDIVQIIDEKDTAFFRLDTTENYTLLLKDSENNYIRINEQ